MKKKLLTLFVTTGNYREFIERIYQLAARRMSSYVCVANVHMLVEAHKSSNFANVVNQADIVTPDGMPLVKSLKLLYGIEQDRVTGMDLMPDLLKKAEDEKIEVYFYGSTAEVIQKTGEYISDHYPLLQVAGAYNPPFRSLTGEEETEIVKKINSSGAKLVFVALGCPKQETWMAGMRGRINACMIGIGGALPVMLGIQKRAPRWMQKLCMEWVFRLIQEPRRLFKRYAITNTTFVWLLLKAWVRLKFSHASENSNNRGPVYQNPYNIHPKNS